MRLRFALLMICVMLAATAAQAQFQVWFFNESFPLTNNCTAGTPLPDGVTIEVWWDSTANGHDELDVRPVEGSGFGQVSFNQFLLNGAAINGTPGTFAADENFTSQDTPIPGVTGAPVYYLKVCQDADNVHWISDTFTVVNGYQEIYFGTGLEEFTCVNEACGGCPPPVSVTNLTGSTTQCDQIVLDWDHTGVNCAGYRVLLVDEFPQQHVYISGSANSTFTHTNQPGGVDVHYRVRAFNVCAPDTSYSPGIDVVGRAAVGPPTPTSMTASDAECGTVRLEWSISTVLGLDLFHIYRDGVFLGTAPRGTAGDDHEFVDNAPLAGSVEYCVYGFSDLCNLGDAACDDGQAGAVPACTVTNVVASDDDCDEVCVTWTATCTDVTEFRVLRNSLLVGTVPVAGPNYSFCHAPAAGVSGGYQIQPVNACGNGTAQPTTPEPGLRLAPPGNVLNIVASDTLCDGVCIIWSDLPAAEQYQIRRDGTTLATQAGDDTTYCDLTAVAGVTYQYTVVGVNVCGVGSVAGGNSGVRRVPGTGTALFTLVTAGPPNWTYSMDVETGCLNTVVIRDFCEGTTATAPNGWTVSVTDDSIIFSSTTAVGAQDAPVTGFGLSHPTCDGDGRWGIGQSGGSIRGPLPVGENAALPTEYSVNVYPNPFNPMTNFKIAVPQASDTRILVFNVTGQLVRDMNMGRMQAGYHTVQFGGSDLPSGMYFAKVLSGNFHSTHKLMLLK